MKNVWFHVLLFFCRRGREGQRSLTTKSSKFETEAAGHNYATMSHDEVSKNHPGGVNDISSTEKEPRMYESEEKDNGYKALKLYLEKVNPKCTTFFQYPKKKKNKTEDAIWYEARPLGIHSLGKMMKSISEEAGLLKIYTNHSVRATAITLGLTLELRTDTSWPFQDTAVNSRWYITTHGLPPRSSTTAAVSCPGLFHQVHQPQQAAKSLKILSRFPCTPKKRQWHRSNGQSSATAQFKTCKSCSILLTKASLFLSDDCKGFLLHFDIFAFPLVVIAQKGLSVDCEIFLFCIFCVFCIL